MRGNPETERRPGSHSARHLQGRPGETGEGDGQAAGQRYPPALQVSHPVQLLHLPAWGCGPASSPASAAGGGRDGLSQPGSSASGPAQESLPGGPRGGEERGSRSWRVWRVSSPGLGLGGQVPLRLTASQQAAHSGPPHGQHRQLGSGDGQQRQLAHPGEEVQAAAQ